MFLNLILRLQPYFSTFSSSTKIAQTAATTATKSHVVAASQTETESASKIAKTAAMTDAQNNVVASPLLFIAPPLPRRLNASRINYYIFIITELMIFLSSYSSDRRNLQITTVRMAKIQQPIMIIFRGSKNGELPSSITPRIILRSGASGRYWTIE